LPARSRGTIDVDLDVLLVYPDVDVLRLGQHGHRHRGGVDAAARLRDRHPLDAVDTALELELAPCPPALDEENGFFEPAYAGRARVHHFDLPALALGVLGVHPRDIGGEEPRLVTTRPRPDLQEHALAIVLVTGEEQALELLFQGCLALLQLVDLDLGQLVELPIAALAQEVAGFALTTKDLPILGEALDDLQAVGVLLAKAGVLGGLAEDGWISEGARELIRALFDLS